MAYWFNVSSGQVETDETRSANEQVMGPYDSEEEARGALEKARANTEKWDAEDEEWRDRGASDSWRAADRD